MNDHTTPPTAATLADLGEEGLLARLFPLIAPADATSTAGTDLAGRTLGVGDDAAVVAAPDGRFVVTVDMLVENVDFRLDWSGGADVGAKAAAQNLADVAAMGAVPTAVVVGFTAPAHTPAEFALDLMGQLARDCRAVGADVVGGDLSSGPLIVVSVTAFGDLQGRAPLTRAGARPGDVLAIAGESGWSAAGLALLLAGVKESDDESAALALERHRRPVPDVPAGARAAIAGATSLIDTSDGLLRDAGRVASASGVAIEIDAGSGHLAEQRSRLTPLAASLGVDAAEWVLSGGEDHCLLATLPADTPLPQGFSPIGRVRAGDGVSVRGVEEGSGRVGYDHFRE